ncbi:U2 snRNP-associated SURP motif-containing protein [Orchesella cincta]|uniref:U2 snRNP-associated SURP motif-containing protein n=1 Tax=Orchesella cincta TaxID=48709 RepID=A0A1D2NHP5_ORCCI|nr:U2 snRNP-associated SURP motif-containing protein [Orchesella cincta]
MKSFQFGTVGKRPSSKKDMEEQKKKLEEQAAAEAFEEYVAVFQETGSSKSAASKVWIKAGTYDAGKRQEDTKDKGKLYKPTSRFEKDGGSGDGESGPPGLLDRPEKPGKKKQTEKKKSNLEIFKEELKIIQEEREERHRLKKMLGLQEVIKLPPKPGDDLRASLSLELDDVRMGSIDDGDPNTTNIYLGNLPTKISEQQLMEVFGKYGPLASVKVMWPRTEEEKARNRLSGFVAFIVPIPAYPVYIPPTMLELTMPPPLSGLPFNAQPDKRDRHKIPPPGTPYPTDQKGKDEFERVLYSAMIKVVMPTDRALLALIHRMVEFVIREGPMFEAMIMNKEISNPQFRFLFENQSPAHVYYRWKLYSILQGDSTQRWRTEEFRMFKGGSVWRPPKLNPFTQGMPDELIPEEEREIRIGSLSNAQRTRLERMLRKITPERHKVAEVMIFSIEHAESADEICVCVKESLSNPKTSLTKRIARLYVLNDVIHNCTAKGMNAFGYRKTFKSHLPSIFQSLHYAYQTACSDNENSTNAESFKQRVLACFKAWDDWGVYSNEFLIRLQNIFLGLAHAESREDEQSVLDLDKHEGSNSDEDEDEGFRKLNLHRKKLHRRKSPPRAQMPPKSALNLVKSLQSTEPEINEELDGVPMDEEEQVSENVVVQNKFIPSKWEELDPEQVKAQAVTTTSKWDLFEEQDKSDGKLVEYEEEDIDGMPMDDEDDDVVEETHRKTLREIEMKVLAFQDELEKRGVNETNLVREYRDKLLRKATSSSHESSSDAERSSSRKATRKRSPSCDNASPRYAIQVFQSYYKYCVVIKQRYCSLVGPPTTAAATGGGAESVQVRAAEGGPVLDLAQGRDPAPQVAPEDRAGGRSARKHKIQTYIV